MLLLVAPTLLGNLPPKNSLYLYSIFVIFLAVRGSGCPTAIYVVAGRPREKYVVPGRTNVILSTGPHSRMRPTPRAYAYVVASHVG